MARIHLFLTKIGIKPDRLRFRQHLKNEMAHYACDCWDAEIQNSYGWIECVGCADRSAYDLTRHTERTNQKLVAREMLKEPKTVERTVLTIDKKKFGPMLKAKAKPAEQYLTSLNDSQLDALNATLQSAGKATITIQDGESIEISKDILSISRATETVHGQS